jgi:hypothetical protein
MIFALTCQLEAVNDAISSLGYNANASDNMKTYGLYNFTETNF